MTPKRVGFLDDLKEIQRNMNTVSLKAFMG